MTKSAPFDFPARRLTKIHLFEGSKTFLKIFVKIFAELNGVFVPLSIVKTGGNLNSALLK